VLRRVVIRKDFAETLILVELEKYLFEPFLDRHHF
jgi:hypothetical protein